MSVMVAITAAVAPAQGPASWADLSRLAKARLEQQRSERLEALQPLLKDFELSYSSNQAFLDKRFTAAVELGDAIVPALTEKLTPWDESDPAAQNLAENSARVLQLLDPAGFVEDLIRTADGPNSTARLLAVRLLGHTRSPVAATALIRMLDKVQGGTQVAAIESLRRLEAREAAPVIAPYLQTTDERLRRAAIEYLAAAPDARVLDAVLTALSAETVPDLLPSYVTYLDHAAPRNRRAAAALLPHLSLTAPDPELTLQVCRTLAHVAPIGDAQTVNACKAILDADETGRLGLAAAMTMRELGDEGGVAVLLKNLNNKISRDRKATTHYLDRGDLYRALEQWEKAAKDYTDAIDHQQTDSPVLRRNLFLLVARCEAHRQRHAAVLKALKDSRADARTIRQEASEDEALREALEQPTIRRYLESL